MKKLTLILFILLLAGCGKVKVEEKIIEKEDVMLGASASFVQYIDKTPVGSANTATTTPINTTTGNFLAVIVEGFGGNSVVTGVTDTAGNTYKKAIGAWKINGAERSEIWYTENITGNANNVVTATYTGSLSFRYISVAEFSGIALSNSFVSSSTKINSSVKYHSSASSTSSNIGDIIVGGYNGLNVYDITNGSGFTTLSSDNTSVYYYAEYKILGAVGIYGADCFSSTSNSSVMVSAIFAVASGSSPPISSSVESDIIFFD